MIPRPHGWVGTSDEWAQGIGIAFAVLDLLVLLVAWRAFRRTGESKLSKTLLFGGIGVLPLAVVFFAYFHGISASQKVEACALGWFLCSGNVWSRAETGEPDERPRQLAGFAIVATARKPQTPPPTCPICNRRVLNWRMSGARPILAGRYYHCKTPGG